MLSRRLAVLLGALVVVVVLALGMIGVLGAVPGNAANGRTVAKERSSTLTVLTKTREARVVDLGPQGPSQGDMRVVNAPLYDESAKQRIGRFDSFCVATDPADEPNEKAHMVECTATFTLPGGEISTQGLDAFPKLPALPPKGVDAISGGTGKYADVRGEVRAVQRGTKFIHTFHFID